MFFRFIDFNRILMKTFLYFFLLLICESSSRSVSKTTQNNVNEIDFRGNKIGNEFQLINFAVMQQEKAQTYEITTVTPTSISNNGMVEVVFKSYTPSETDWIGAYDADSDLSETVPIKFAQCNTDNSYIMTGVGTLYFNFTNTRSDIKFHYFTGSLTSPVLVATSTDTLTFINKNEPLRPRIVPIGTVDRNTFKLLWSSATSINPVLMWGVEPGGPYGNTVYADTSRIDRSQMCGHPANSSGWADLGLIHTAHMKGMIALAGWKLFYVFGDADTGDFSVEHTFHVPPIKG